MEQEVTIIKRHVSHEHVPLFVSVPPHLAPASLMQSIKDKSSRHMFLEHPFLKKQLWGQHLWAWGCFCASSGTVTDEVIKEYIEHQDNPLDDGFNIADDAQWLQPALAGTATSVAI